MKHGSRPGCGRRLPSQRHESGAVPLQRIPEIQLLMQKGTFVGLRFFVNMFFANALLLHRGGIYRGASKSVWSRKVLEVSMLFLRDFNHLEGGIDPV